MLCKGVQVHEPLAACSAVGGEVPAELLLGFKILPSQLVKKLNQLVHFCIVSPDVEGGCDFLSTRGTKEPRANPVFCPRRTGRRVDGSFNSVVEDHPALGGASNALQMSMLILAPVHDSCNGNIFTGDGVKALSIRRDQDLDSCHFQVPSGLYDFTSVIGSEPIDLKAEQGAVRFKSCDHAHVCMPLINELLQRNFFGSVVAVGQGRWQAR